MKWIFLLALLVLTPVMMNALRDRPQRILWVGLLIGLGPFIITPFHLSMAPISWPVWQGIVKGIEITLYDALAIAVIGATKPRPTPALLKFSVGLIAFGLVISTIAAADPTPSIFYIWQFMRTCLLFVAVLRATASNPEFPFRVLIGYAIGMASQAILTLTQMAGGDIQAGGSFGHQNQLGLVTMFIVFPAFALFLAKQRVKISVFILLCEAIIAFTGGSRATIGLFGLGILLTLALSIWHKSSGRKATAAAATVFLVALAAPIMMLAIERRSDELRAGSTDERRKFEHAAQMIISDHPLGVGANRYVVVANLGGYSDRAGVPWNYSERSAPVHNAYYLIAAEQSLFGLTGYLFLLATIILIGLRALKKAQPNISSEFLVGLIATSIITAIHFYFEWVAMLYVVHFLVAINAAMLVAISTAGREEKGKPPFALKRRPAPAAA